VPREPGTLDAQALGLFLRDRLPAYKIPGLFELRADLPKNPAGKVLKEALRGETVE
jgi:long-chain acyl-CoA synthetase